MRIVLQSHCEGTSNRGISRISGLSYNTGVSLIRAGSQKAQLVHNAQVQAIDTDAVSASEMWSFALKKHSSLFAGGTRSRRLLDCPKQAPS